MSRSEAAEHFLSTFFLFISFPISGMELIQEITSWDYKRMKIFEPERNGSKPRSAICKLHDFG